MASRPNIDGLTGPVDVVRDKYGMVHIYATNQNDAFRVQGYQVARDRTAQLELLRRAATGRLAEVLGAVQPSLVDQDIAMRTQGLARPAKETLAAASPEILASIQAYVDGISQFNARVRSGAEKLPDGIVLLSTDAFQPWTPDDVIAVARLQASMLSYTANGEMALSAFVENARDVMKADSADAKLAKRAGLLVDVVRFAPIDPTTVLDGFPTATMSAKASGDASKPNGSAPSFRPSRDLLDGARAFQTALDAATDIAGGRRLGVTGSNNWIIGSQLSQTGHPLLANDPHLQLSAPAVFWTVHIKVDAANPDDNLDFAGTAFPGLPAVILGFNQNVAWGATTAFFDVTDVYQETLTPDNSGVVFNGTNVPFEKVHETINTGTGNLEYDVLIVPHHGPIVPTITASHTVTPPSGKALSVKWTGHKPTNDLNAVFGMLRAKNVDDAHKSLSAFAVGAQNWVVVDDSDNILYTAHALVPKRAKAAFTWDPATFTGTLPGLVLPGDGSAEWTGQFIEDAYLPQAKNPAKGYIVTANNDQVGTLLDNDPSNEKLPNGEPVYISSFYTMGLRAGRITQRIEGAGHKLTIDDLANIQADARSPLGSRLTANVIAAIGQGIAEKATPGTHPDLQTLVGSDRWKNAPIAEIEDLLTRWGTEADYVAAWGINPDDNKPLADAKENMASRATTLFNVWFGQMMTLTLGDELTKIGGSRGAFEVERSLTYLLTTDATALKTFDATMKDSILFDDLNTPEVESRNERILHALLDTVDFLRTRLGTDTTQWQWGRLHTLRFDALVPLWASLSIPPTSDPVFPNGFPRHGDAYNVDVGTFGYPSKLDANASYSYGFGPSQRFVAGMDPKASVRRNVLPGGNVWDAKSPHFRDEAELWRRNQNRPIPFTTDDVVGAAEERVVYETKK